MNLKVFESNGDQIKDVNDENDDDDDHPFGTIPGLDYKGISS